MFARFAIAVLLAAPLAARADEDRPPAEGVRKVELTIDPAEAKPGQTVTLKLKVTLAAGCNVYPFVQPDKNADSFTSKAKFPKTPDGLIYIGKPTTDDPAETRTDPDLQKAFGIESYQTLFGKPTGAVTFQLKAVVSPKATAGPLTAKFDSLRLNVCQGKDCYRQTELKPEAKLTVLAGPAVEVEKAFAEDVKKALESK